MTAPWLEIIRARLEAATPAPWSVKEYTEKCKLGLVMSQDQIVIAETFSGTLGQWEHQAGRKHSRCAAFTQQSLFERKE